MITSSVTAVSKLNVVSSLTHKAQQLDAQNYTIKKKRNSYYLAEVRLIHHTQ